MYQGLWFQVYTTVSQNIQNTDKSFQFKYTLINLFIVFDNTYGTYYIYIMINLFLALQVVH